MPLEVTRRVFVIDGKPGRDACPHPRAIASTAAARRDAHREATALIAANDNAPPKPRLRDRHTRPAWTWLAKKDAKAAASLWLIARGLLPADNDNHPEPGMTSLDTRNDGTPRGARVAPQPKRDYLDLPAALPSPLDPPATSWKVTADLPDHDFHPDCRFGYCAPAVAAGAWFMGAAGGVGQSKIGKSRGDARRQDEPDMPEIPDRFFVVIENMLARADLAGIGRALGYNGGYADRAGGRALLDAGEWAVKAVEAHWPHLEAEAA